MIVLHHRNQVHAGRQRSTLLEVGCSSLLNPGHLGCYALNDTGVMKGVEALDGLHLLLRFQILEDPAGGDHVVQIDARNHDHTMLAARRRWHVR